MRTKEGDKESDIIAAAICIFGKDGFSDAKMHAIADKAGIGIGTVYLYFSNKEKILLRILELVWKKLHEIILTVKNRDDLDPVLKMNALIDMIFDYLAANSLLTLVFVNEGSKLVHSNNTASFVKIQNSALAESESLIADGQKQGFFNSKVSTMFFNQFFFGGIRNTILQWANDPKKVSLEELRHTIKIVMFSGIARHEPLKKTRR